MINTEEILTIPKKINTGNGYSNDLIATTNDRLERTIKALILLNSTYQEENKKVRDTMKKFETTMKEIDKKNGKLQNALFWLTVVTSIATIVQVVLAFNKP